MNDALEVAARIQHRLREPLDARVDELHERDRPDQRLPERNDLCKRPVRRCPAYDVDHENERDDAHAREIKWEILSEYPLGEAQRPLNDKQCDNNGHEDEQPVDKAA